MGGYKYWDEVENILWGRISILILHMLSVSWKVSRPNASFKIMDTTGYCSEAIPPGKIRAGRYNV